MLSLCIPTYNRLPFLKQCLNSLLNKFGDYPYEIIIADGGSTDGTLDYLKSLNSDNVKLIEQGKLTGITKAYNVSFKIAKGDYIFIGNDDHVLIPEVLINSCKLMEKEDEIGLVAVKMQEPTYGNLHGVTRSEISRYWILLSKIHIFRSSALKDSGYIDEAFRSYYIDNDSTLNIMKLGYTTIFTRDVGVIHYRVQDQNTNTAKAINYAETKSKKEYEYFKKKWKKLETEVNECLRRSLFLKNKSLFFSMICDKIYYSKSLRPFVQKNNKVSMALFDWLLEQTVVFIDKNYNNLDDFFLPQRYPEEIISSLD